MHKGEDLDCKVLCIMMRHLKKYLEIFFFWNRISLDLNHSRLRLAGTLLTVITEMFNSERQRFEIFIRLCNSTPK